jgi:hypothetical protein
MLNMSRWIGLRNESLVILLYLVVLTIMTYPLMFKLGEIIPFHNPDTYTAIWQNWWLQQILTRSADANYTTYLFYPNGLDVTLIPQRWTSYPLWAFYNTLWGEPVAYNVTVLTQSLVKAYAMFRLILLFVPHRPSAWIGGAFFAFSPRILVSAIQQPNTGAVEFIPIFMIAFVLALRCIHDQPDNFKKIALVMGLAGVAFSANIYMNLKIGVFAMLIGGCYALWVFVIHQLWRQRVFWGGMTIFVLVTVIICAPILLPTLTYPDLNSAINQYVPDNGLNILSYVKADLKYPFFYNNIFAFADGIVLNQLVYVAFAQIGFTGVVLGIIGAGIAILKQREHLIWLVITLLFFWLSLGATIIIGNTKLDGFPTLYPLLLNNPIFVALRQPFRFQIIMIFGLSILLSLAISWLFQRFSKRIATLMCVFILPLLLFELSVFPIPYRLATRSPAYDYVAQQEDSPLIVMPMGRQQAKFAMYHQTFHERPMAEGMIARMPEDAYDYIESNLLLHDMTQINNIVKASDELIANWDNEIDQLLNDGFRYVVIHRLEDTGTWKIATHTYQERMFFMEIEPDFETETEAVYDLRKLRGNPPQGDPLAED